MLKNTQTDTECLTVCGPCKPFISFSAVTGPSHQSELYENNLPSTAVGFNKNWSSMINVKGKLDTKICAFRSRRSHASRPSGAGKVHAQHTFKRAHICTHTHTQTRSQSPPLYRIWGISDAVCLACSTAEQCQNVLLYKVQVYL